MGDIVSLYAENLVYQVEGAFNEKMDEFLAVEEGGLRL